MRWSGGWADCIRSEGRRSHFDSDFKRRRHAPSPVFFGRPRAGPRANCNSRPPIRGERSAGRRGSLRSLPERLAKPPETPCEGVSSSLAIGTRRIPAFFFVVFFV